MYNLHRQSNGLPHVFHNAPAVSDDDLAQGLFYFVENPKGFFVNTNLHRANQEHLPEPYFLPSMPTWSWARSNEQVGVWPLSKLLFMKMENDLTTAIHLFEKLTQAVLTAEEERRLVWRAPSKERRYYHELNLEAEKYFELNQLLEPRFGKVVPSRDKSQSHYNFPYVKQYVGEQGWDLEVVA